MTGPILADRFTMCESGMHQVPIGEEVFTVSGQIFCKECLSLSERKTAREACGVATTKAHWKDKQPERRKAS